MPVPPSSRSSDGGSRPEGRGADASPASEEVLDGVHLGADSDGFDQAEFQQWLRD